MTHGMRAGSVFHLSPPHVPQPQSASRGLTVCLYMYVSTSCSPCEAVAGRQVWFGVVELPLVEMCPAQFCTLTVLLAVRQPLCDDVLVSRRCRHSPQLSSCMHGFWNGTTVQGVPPMLLQVSTHTHFCAKPRQDKTLGPSLNTHVHPSGNLHPTNDISCRPARPT